jgi:HSP20 family protein
MDLVPFRGRRGLARRTLEDDLGDVFGRFLDSWGFGPLFERGYQPALDVSETDEAVVVKAELPGMTRDDIDISVQGNTLTIGGEKKETAEDRGKDYYVSERRYGTFRRALTLPSGVDAEHIEAKYRDGVLTVTLPKSEQAKPKRINVKG